jgi:hypothetical protein
VRGKVAIPRVLFNSFRRHFQQLQAQNEREKETSRRFEYSLCGMVSIRGRKRAFQKYKGKGQQSGAWHSYTFNKVHDAFCSAGGARAVLLCIILPSFSSTFSRQRRKVKKPSCSDTAEKLIPIWLFPLPPLSQRMCGNSGDNIASGERKACVSLNSRRQ